MTDTTDSPPPSTPPAAGRQKKTVVFAAGLLAVLAVFIVLSMLGGPPAMPRNDIHKALKTDTSCLACHNWPDHLGPGESVVKPLGANHPPPRPKKKRPGTDVDAGAGVVAPMEFECIKCHAPR
ncbi:MAG: hypothetical protein AB2A00_37355 [Myxococcota bacterium]